MAHIRLADAGQNFLHTLKLVAFQFSTGRFRRCQKPVHQGQQVATESAFAGIALENLLRVLGVDRDFFSSAVIAPATKLAADSDFSPGAFHIQRNAALCSRGFERSLSLQLVNVDVSTRFVHRASGFGCDE